MADVTVAILAGGQSRRMGMDKSFTPLHGKPIFEHVLNRVRKLNLPINLVSNTPEKYAHYELPVYTDILPDKGSLGGLYTAIQVSETEFTLAVACDMPFLNIALLRHQLDLCAAEWDIIVPRVRGHPEAMHSVYSKSCLIPIQQQLKEGNYRATGFFKQMRARYVEEAEVQRFDPEFRSFINLNTLEDLAAAQNLHLE